MLKTKAEYEHPAQSSQEQCYPKGTRCQRRPVSKLRLNKHGARSMQGAVSRWFGRNGYYFCNFILARISKIALARCQHLSRGEPGRKL